MYAFIARGQDVLCEYAAFQGNFSKVAVECLAKCPAHNAKFTYNADKHTFNFIVFNGYSACCRACDPFRAAMRCAFAAARHRVDNSGASRVASLSLSVRGRRRVRPPNPVWLPREGEGRLHQELWRDGAERGAHVAHPRLRVRAARGRSARSRPAAPASALRRTGP